MRNAGLEEAQAGIKITRRNINNLRYARYASDTTSVADSEEKLKSLLMKVKQESKKAGLKFNIQKIKIMASGHITSWQIDGENNGNSDRFYLLGLQNHWTMTAALKLKILVPLKKSYDKPRQCIKKQRHHFADKVLSSQNYGFSSGCVQMLVGP